MSEGALQFSFPAGSTATMVFTGEAGQSKVHTSVPDIAAGWELVLVCDRCKGQVETGRRVHVDDLPLERSGTRRHDCGGTGRMPLEYVVNDQRTGRQIDIYRVEREQITVSAVTLAELLRLSQAARAVEAGKPGATDRLDQVLQESPEAVRRLRDLAPTTKTQWYAVAALVLSLAAILVPLLKGGDGVSEQQLIHVIEQLIESHQQPDNPSRDEHQGTSGGQPGVEPRDVGPPGTGGQGHPQSSKEQRDA